MAATLDVIRWLEGLENKAALLIGVFIIGSILFRKIFPSRYLTEGKQSFDQLSHICEIRHRENEELKQDLAQLRTDYTILEQLHKEALIKIEMLEKGK